MSDVSYSNSIIGKHRKKLHLTNYISSLYSRIFINIIFRGVAPFTTISKIEPKIENYRIISTVI